LPRSPKLSRTASCFLSGSNVDAGAEHADGPPPKGERSVMRNGVDPARESAGDHDSTYSQIATEALRHLRTVECRLAGTNDTQARRIEYLRIAAHIEHHRRVVNLQQRLRIFGLSPIDDARGGHFAQVGQIFFGALE
jgi:hypothetical protein